MTTPLVEIYLKNFDRLLAALEEYYNYYNISNKEEIIELIETEFNFPVSDTTLKEMMLSPFILDKCLESISSQLMYNLGEERIKRRNVLCKMRNASVNPMLIRIRRFSPNGYYYGKTFRTDDGDYFFLRDEPILTTIYNYEQLGEQFHGFPIRQEVRILASLAFSLQTGACSFHLLQGPIDVPVDLILGGGNEFKDIPLNRIEMVIKVLERFENASHWANKPTFIKSNSFKFRNFDMPIEKAEKLYNCLQLTDDLALRTSFLLLKSKMLWEDESGMYFEDACASLFFGMEGCLRMVDRGLSKDGNFVFKRAMKHIQDVFQHGPGYLEMLEDVYKLRTQIVHPEMKLSWMPELSSDDYYENYEIATDLIYYGITNELLPRIYW